MKLQPRIFCLWTDKNIMSKDRYHALSTIKNSGLKVIYINIENLSSWVVENTPLHPAYSYLSSVHKADYLRCYLMHHHGGAYSDIKVIENSWLLPFEQLEKSDCLINGYREVSCLETARGRGLIKDLWLALNFHKVIGNGAYICKPNTTFTKDWIDSVHDVLDTKFDTLKKYPAQDSRDFFNKVFENGSVSNYPLRWTEICGEIFHPLCLKYSNKLLKNLPTPDFTLKYL
jgi:hypothetical protein